MSTFAEAKKAWRKGYAAKICTHMPKKTDVVLFGAKPTWDYIYCGEKTHRWFLNDGNCEVPHEYQKSKNWVIEK